MDLTRSGSYGWLQPSAEVGEAIRLFQKTKELQDFARQAVKEIHRFGAALKSEGCRVNKCLQFEEVEFDYSNVPSYAWENHRRLTEFMQKRLTRLTRIISDLQDTRRALEEQLTTSRSRLAALYVDKSMKHHLGVAKKRTI